MPETINGFPFFQLCAGLNPVDTVNYEELRASYGSGFRSQSLIGADTGNKSWSFPFPVLGNSTNQTIVFQGKTYTSPQQYVRDLFAWQKVTGTPFVVADPNYGQYYLAEFAESSLTMTKKMSGLYASEIRLGQVRLPGVTVFDPSKLDIWGNFMDAANTLTASGWADSSSNNHDLVPSELVPDDIVIETDAQNGLSVVTFNEFGGDQNLFYDNEEEVLFKQFFIVLRINEEEFSNYAGIIAPDGAGSFPFLLGNEEDTKFFDLDLSNSQVYTFEKNSVSYAESNQLAPMEEFALVYIRAETGFPASVLQLGKDRDFTDRYAKMSVGQFIPTTTDLGAEKTRELIEHLMTKWDLH